MQARFLALTSIEHPLKKGAPKNEEYWKSTHHQQELSSTACATKRSIQKHSGFTIRYTSACGGACYVLIVRHGGSLSSIQPHSAHEAQLFSYSTLAQKSALLQVFCHHAGEHHAHLPRAPHQRQFRAAPRALPAGWLYETPRGARHGPVRFGGGLGTTPNARKP